MTRLEFFLTLHGVKPSDLARVSGYSRQHLLRVRSGRMEPTRRCIAAVVRAAGKLSGLRIRASELFELGDSDDTPNLNADVRGEFELLGTFEDFIAQEEACGAAIPVTDDTMSPVLQQNDVVRVERREALPDEVLCVQLHGVDYFGYRVGDALQRVNGPDVLLDGSERVMGVATAVIDRAVYGRAEQDLRNVSRGNVVSRAGESRNQP